MSSMKAQKKPKTTLKKVLLNLSLVLLGIFYLLNVIAGENAVQINTVLGIASTKKVYTGTGDPNQYPRYFDTKYKSVAELKAAGLSKAREAEAEGAVLLKNDNNTLPFKGDKLSLFGATAISPVYGGTGSGAVSADDAPTYPQVLKEAGFSVVNQRLLDWYKAEKLGRDFSKGDINESSWKKIMKSEASNSFGQGEDALFIIGRVGGEANDLRSVDHNDGKNGDYLTLNKQELQILEGLKGLKDEKKIASITVLFNSANPVSAAFLADPAYGVDAALWIGSVGQTGLYAVADILKGNVNPSGSLPDAWWMDNLLNPAMANFGTYTYENSDKYQFGSAERPFTSYVVYQEGIYVGYRYAETRYEDVVLGTPSVGEFDYNKVIAYPFGYGMSYSSFQTDELKVEKSGEGMKAEYSVTVKVTNTGAVKGKKAVQVYAQKPYTQYDIDKQIEKASVELVGYAKTDLLEPGASQTVTVKVPEYFLSSYDALGTGAFILSEGKHYLAVGDNAHDALNNILAMKGKTVQNGMTADGNAALAFETQYAFNATTYALSYGTGAPVKSLFALSDINRYEGRGDNSVKYLSRNDWAGTLRLWTPNDNGHNTNFVKLTMTDQIAADAVLDQSDLPKNDDKWPVMGEEKTKYQLIDLMKAEDGSPLPFGDAKWQDFLNQLSYGQLARLCAVGLRMTINIDEIGKPETLDHNGPSGVTQKYSIGSNGFANQLKDPDKDKTGTCFPCNGIIAASFNDQLALEVGEIIGEDAMWAGYAGLYGTGVNIHRTPYAGRVFEYYSEDGILTGLIATKETQGIQSKGVYVYNKHLVLNDQEEQRQGLGTWCNEQALREIYLRAFELPIVNADAKCVMTAFNRLGALWAGASKALVTDWLRGEAGMTGFAVTDMYDGIYMSKPHEVLAGNDIPDNYPGVTGTGTSADTHAAGLGAEFAAYGPNGTTPTAQIAQAMREAAHRILYTVVHSRGMDGLSADIKIVSVTPWWSTALNAAIYSFAGISALLTVVMVLDILKRNKAK